jgi:hypothetical protein
MPGEEKIKFLNSSVRILDSAFPFQVTGGVIFAIEFANFVYKSENLNIFNRTSGR